jgi:predicted esterase
MISFMKSISFATLTISIFLTIACHGNNSGESANESRLQDSAVVRNETSTDSFPTGKLIDRVLCKSDPTESYALYIPAKDGNKILPVIYFFDPHGDGLLPVKKYKALADIYHFILIGSNNSKNGNDWTATEDIWKVLSDDSQKRLPIDAKRIYTGGFSGGAKVATYIALTHPDIRGVIAGGAALAEMAAKGENLHFSFSGIVGQGDMNMTDLVAINNSLDKTATRHRLIFFDGKHEWAPESTMNIAFAGLQLDAMANKIEPADEHFISQYVEGSKGRIDAFISKQNYLRAGDECKVAVSFLDRVTDKVNWFKEKDSQIQMNSAYKKQRQLTDELVATENQIKEGFMQKFQQPDINYWNKEIKDVQMNAMANTANGAMYQRLQAYLSLAFYSFSNQLINQNQDDGAKYFVELYKMADPANPEAWYFSAILDARENNAGATESDLNKSVANGFNDKERLEKQSEFQRLGSKINLAAIEQKIKP